MNYQYKLLEIEAGHTIVTPKGEPITKEELREYFSIVCQWIEEVNPESLDKIQPSVNNRKTYGSMINKMFEAIAFGPAKKGCCQTSFLGDRQLAFLFVVSYYIQEENRERTTPFLNHVMGRALLEWLPIPWLVEYYLALSAQRGGACDDALLLCKMFSEEPCYRRFGFERSPDKVLKYAKIALKSPFYKYYAEEIDLVCEEALLSYGKPHDVE